MLTFFGAFTPSRTWFPLIPRTVTTILSSITIDSSLRLERMSIPCLEFTSVLFTNSRQFNCPRFALQIYVTIFAIVVHTKKRNYRATSCIDRFISITEPV